jgi:hypothetical protein
LTSDQNLQRVSVRSSITIDSTHQSDQPGPFERNIMHRSQLHRDSFVGFVHAQIASRNQLVRVHHKHSRLGNYCVQSGQPALTSK